MVRNVRAEVVIRKELSFIDDDCATGAEVGAKVEVVGVPTEVTVKPLVVRAVDKVVVELVKVDVIAAAVVAWADTV
jgi:hypothetical protein